MKRSLPGFRRTGSKICGNCSIRKTSLLGWSMAGLQSSWIANPAIKIVVDFEQSLKKYPPILPGTPDPYMPPNSVSSNVGSSWKPY